MGLPPRYFDIVPDVLPKGTLLRAKHNSRTYSFAWLVLPEPNGYWIEAGFPKTKEKWECNEYPILVNAIAENDKDNPRNAVVLWKNQFWAVVLHDFEVVHDD